MTGGSDARAGDPAAPSVVVLPAVGEGDAELPDDAPTELDRWLDAYDFERAIEVRGANASVRCTDSGIAVTPTGMGKVEAATTVTALLSSPRFELSDAYFLSTGIAGAPPDVGTLGAVFVADAVIDWDLKHRWSNESSDVELLGYRPRDYAYQLDEELVERGVRIAETVDLRDTDEWAAYRRRYDAEAARSTPFVATGATVCGDEFWHGRECSELARWLVEQYDAGAYATSEMEDFGTAATLDRFDALDRYLSVRSVANFDRPPKDESPEESLDDGLAIDLALENAFRATSAIAESLAENRRTQ